MALIEVFHVVASNLLIDADNSVDIPQGSLVSLDSNGKVVLADAADADLFPIGIAGDSRSTGVTSYTPESGSALSSDPKNTLEGALVIGALGAGQRFTQTRTADNYNEVLASGKMTVYHGGGEFWTDQYETLRDNGAAVASYTPAARLFASNATNITGSNGGKFTDDADESLASAKIVVGHVLSSPTAYPSGVPGTGDNATGFSSLPEGGNSIAWGTFLHLKLVV